MDVYTNTQTIISKDDDDIEENCQSISQTNFTVNERNEVHKDNIKTDPTKIQEICKTDKKKRKRPNCFLSIPINNEKVLGRLSVLLKRMVEVEADMKQVSNALEKIHLTLGIFNLETESEIEGAKRAMQASLIKIKNLGSIFPTLIRLSGIESFKSGVLFVKVIDFLQKNNDKLECGVDEGSLVGMNTVQEREDNMKEDKMKDDNMIEDDKKEDKEKEDKGRKDKGSGIKRCKMDNVKEKDYNNTETSLSKLEKITKILHQKFDEEGLMDVSNDKPLILHATIAKASKARFHQQKKFKAMIQRVSRVIDGEDYGLQEVSRIDLCWMSQTDHTAKGYKIIHSIDLA